MIKEDICQRFQISVGVFLLGLSILSVSVSAASADYCTLQELVIQYSSSQEAIRPDYECLLSVADLPDSLDAYQIIDSRSEDVPILSGAWRIPISELRHKSFLKSEQLLVVTGSFGLYDKAYDCARLRNAGFSVQFITGSLWKNTSVHSKEVSAKDIYKEYLHGKLVLVATSEAVSKKLESISMKEHLTVKFLNNKDIGEIALAYSGNGLMPVVLVGDHESTLNTSSFNFSNIYTVKGGVNALGIYYRDMKLSLAAKQDRESRRVCGKI